MNAKTAIPTPVEARKRVIKRALQQLRADGYRVTGIASDYTSFFVREPGAVAGGSTVTVGTPYYAEDRRVRSRFDNNATAALRSIVQSATGEGA